MEVAEILKQFERVNGKFPRAAVEAAADRREEIIPELLRILEDTAASPIEIAADQDRIAHFYAMFLLAQFRETRAYPLMVRIASLPSEVLDSLLDFFITDSLDRVLVSVCGGELEGIKSIVENSDANDFARGAAIRSLMMLALAGKKSRTGISDYFAQLFGGKLEREHGDVWNVLVSCCCDVGAEQLMGGIEQAYKDDLVDPSYISLEDVEASMGRPHQTQFFIESTIDEMGPWICFRDRETAEPKKQPGLSWTIPTPSKAVPLAAIGYSAPEPQLKKAEPKTGRNEPCPCGGGKKYKKCCGS